jgi:hypothetical protein
MTQRFFKRAASEIAKADVVLVVIPTISLGNVSGDALGRATKLAVHAPLFFRREQREQLFVDEDCEILCHSPDFKPV